MIIKCRNCHQSAEKANKQSGNICVECYKAYLRDYNEKNKIRIAKHKQNVLAQNRLDPQWVEAERQRGRVYAAQMRRDSMMAYGGYVCACCGETEEKFLTLDHIFNDGAAHRKMLGHRGSGINRWLKDHGYPAGFQVLCMNCNYGKQQNGGICPHKTTHDNRVNSGKAQTG